MAKYEKSAQKWWISCASAGFNLAFALCPPAPAQVDFYEANAFPEQACCWQRVGAQNAERRIENGLLIQTAAAGQQDDYSTDVHHFAWYGDTLFVEWRAMTDYPESLIDDWQVPAVVAAGGRAGVLYHVVMTESAAVLLRDIFIPRVIVPIAPGEMHTYRVDIFPDEYIWYIDGVVVDSGVPEGPYPDPNAGVSWGVDGYEGITATTAFDYIRYGIVPLPGSGDYDNDGQANFLDTYFVADCLAKDGPDLFGGPIGAGPGAGPGCDFADFTGDMSVDLSDWAAYQNAFFWLYCDEPFCP